MASPWRMSASRPMTCSGRSGRNHDGRGKRREPWRVCLEKIRPAFRIRRPRCKGRRQEGRRLMTASHSDALVLFGVTGDLAHKMIFPALYAMVKRGDLKVPVIGVAFPKWSLAQLHKRVTDSLKRSGGIH